MSVETEEEKDNVCEVCGKTFERNRTPHVHTHVISHNDERQSLGDEKEEAEAQEEQQEKAEAEEEKRIEKELLKLKRKVEIQNLESEQLQCTLKLKMFQKEKGQLLKQKLEIEQTILQLKKSERLATKSITDLKLSIRKLTEKKL